MNIRSLKFKIIVLLALFTVFMTITVGVSFYVTNSQTADARVMDVAGRQRMLTQKMTMEMFALVSFLEGEENVDALRKGLLGTISLFDKTLNALKNGGITIGAEGNEVTIPKSSEETLVKLKEVENIWIGFKRSMDFLLAPNADITSDDFWNSIDIVKKGNTPLLKTSNNIVIELKKESEAKTVLLKKVLLIALVSMVLLSVISLYFANTMLFRPLKELIERVKDIAEGEGDLTKRIEISSNDEIGELAKWFNTFLTKLQGIIREIAVNTKNLSASSEELSVFSSQIASGSEQQLDRASQVATSSEEMSATILEVAKNVSSASDATAEANSAATNGGEIVSQTIESINSIALTTKESSRVIAGLDSRSQEISAIVEVINDIADQTNLLALNAAIEAARAGEQGRGFAVVADEVRKLAERTTKATKEIGEMISAIQNDTGKALTSMDEEVKIVEEGVKLAESAGAALRVIEKDVEVVNAMIGQIATASEEQSNAAEQISADVESVAEITKESSSGNQQIAKASQELNALASNLRVAVDSFKV